MTIRTRQEIAQMTEREVKQFWFEVFISLPVASEDEVENGVLTPVYSVAAIVDELPSARQYTKNMDNVIGWRGNNYKEFVVLSRDDDARVGALQRAWERA